MIRVYLFIDANICQFWMHIAMSFPPLGNKSEEVKGSHLELLTNNNVYTPVSRVPSIEKVFSSYLFYLKAILCG